jgi:acyl carrier protein
MEITDVRTLVLKKTADLAGIQPEDITDATNLDSLGLDSADAVVLAMEIEQATGREIEVGVFLRCETIAETAAEIARIVAGAGAASAAPGSAQQD